MKLYIMKKDAIEHLKSNMKIYYINYYREVDNKWIYEIFDYNPFEFFMEISDFKLAPYKTKTGEMDLENCKIIYSNLIRISESQASDERLWAGLCNSTFYQYCRMRWGYGSKRQTSPDEDADAIISRFFFRDRFRSGFFRNTLAKCWWVGHGTYQENSSNKFELLDALGSDDLSTKITDLFYSYTFASNPSIVRGICMGWKVFMDRGIKLSVKEYFRPALQHMNARGGGILLDILDENEIKDIFVEYISQLYNKGIINSVFVRDIDVYEEDDEELLEDETNEDIRFMQKENMKENKRNVIDEIFEADIKTIGSLQTKNEVQSRLLNKAIGKPKQIIYGCSVILNIVEENRDIRYIIPNKESKDKWYEIYTKMLGKGIGEQFKIRAKTYVVKDISW